MTTSRHRVHLQAGHLRKTYCSTPGGLLDDSVQHRHVAKSLIAGLPCISCPVSREDDAAAIARGRQRCIELLTPGLQPQSQEKKLELCSELLSPVLQPS